MYVPSAAVVVLVHVPVPVHATVAPLIGALRERVRHRPADRPGLGVIELGSWRGIPSRHDKAPGGRRQVPGVRQLNRVRPGCDRERVVAVGVCRCSRAVWWCRGR